MKRTAISLIFAVLISVQLVSALQFELSSPLTAAVNESFSVSISLSTSDIYDVKVFVNDDTKANSEMFYNNKWNSPANYFISAFPSTSQFTIRAYKIGDFPICARLRKTGTTSPTYTECNNISVTQQTTQTPPSSPVAPTVPAASNSTSPVVQDSSNSSAISTASPASQQTKTTVQNVKTSEDFIPAKSSSQSSETPSNDKVVLYSPDSQKSQVYETSAQITREWILYSFLIICVFIIIFLALKNL